MPSENHLYSLTKISIEKADPSDALRISVLLKTAYIQAYAYDGISFEYANFVTNRFSVQYIEKSIQKKSSLFLVAFNEGNIVGVAEIIYNSLCPIRKTNVVELSKLYVHQTFIGKGIGKALMNAIESELRSMGKAHINLEVYIKNQDAIAFYEKQGFTIIGSVDCVMEENSYEDLIMNKVLT